MLLPKIFDVTNLICFRNAHFAVEKKKHLGLHRFPKCHKIWLCRQASGTLLHLSHSPHPLALIHQGMEPYPSAHHQLEILQFLCHQHTPRASTTAPASSAKVRPIIAQFRRHDSKSSLFVCWYCQGTKSELAGGKRVCPDVCCGVTFPN